ncbi:MAG: serine/threonine protein kinase, partial [Pseudomonas sp.]|nr:serine/threonine protein kinase [Pseudomonas sp.]
IEQVQATGAKRVLIDSLGAWSRLSTEPDRLNAFFRALTGELRNREVSVMLTWEMRDIFGAEITAPAPDLSSIVDNLVLMRFVEHDGTLRRMLSILKVRDSAHDASLHELVIASSGISLRRAFEGTSGALSGTAVPQGSL